MLCDAERDVSVIAKFPLMKLIELKQPSISTSFKLFDVVANAVTIIQTANS